MNQSHQRLLICITHFNDLLALEACLESVVTHNPPSDRVSVLIVDDHSDRYIYQTIHARVKHLPSITLICTNVTFGPSATRNCGINFAIENKFSHITFIDCDDLMTGTINTEDIASHDITFFNFATRSASKPTDACATSLFDTKSFDLKRELLVYLNQPNKAPHLTRCWSKVYSTKLLLEWNIRFDERMKTFEDVKFLLTCLSKSYNVKTIDSQFYLHQSRGEPSGATFGELDNFNSLFSFLALRHKLKRLIEINHIKDVNLHHYFACYYSISLVRLATKISSRHLLFAYVDFIRRRVRSPFFRRCFREFHPELAGLSDRLFLIERIFVQDYLSVSMQFIYWSKVRYG